MPKRIKLIHEKNQNEHSFYGFEYSEKINNDFDSIIKKSFNDIGNYNKNRSLEIITYGQKIKEHKEPKCDIIFDVSIFSTKIEKTDIKKLNGKDEIIQNAIIQHPIYNILIETVIREIEQNDFKVISFVCNHGKHRSVGWAEILKNFYYPNAKIKHLRKFN
jgi:RNase adaptor protein for sRNA GlmZ degradation